MNGQTVHSKSTYPYPHDSIESGNDAGENAILPGLIPIICPSRLWSAFQEGGQGTTDHGKDAVV